MWLFPEESWCQPEQELLLSQKSHLCEQISADMHYFYHSVMYRDNKGTWEPVMWQNPKLFPEGHWAPALLLTELPLLFPQCFLPMEGSTPEASLCSSCSSHWVKPPQGGNKGSLFPGWRRFRKVAHISCSSAGGTELKMCWGNSQLILLIGPSTFHSFSCCCCFGSTRGVHTCMWVGNVAPFNAFCLERHKYQWRKLAHPSSVPESRRGLCCHHFPAWIYCWAGPALVVWWQWCPLSRAPFPPLASEYLNLFLF